MSVKKTGTFDKSNLEILDYISGDPNCKQPGCFGKGYQGITVEGIPIRCKCAVIRTPNSVLVMEGQQKLNDQMIQLENALVNMKEALTALIKSQNEYRAAQATEFGIVRSLIQKVMHEMNGSLIRTKIKNLFSRKKEFTVTK